MKKRPYHSYNINLLKYLVPLIALSLIISACNPATQNPPETEPVQTEEDEVLNSPIPPTDTPLPNTAAPTSLPVSTSTPLPLVYFAGNTNCRSGPGSVYDKLHTYMTGDQARLQGISPDGFFWYTSGEEAFLPECWAWNHYATPVGDTSQLPVFTPPPTPTPSPDYEVAWVETSGAAGSLYLFLEIENTGSVAWESALLFLHEPTVPQDAGRFSNTFQVNVHSELPTTDNIPPGGSGYFVSGRLVAPGNYGKIGDLVDFYFIACTEQYLGGYCISRMWTESVW